MDSGCKSGHHLVQPVRGRGNNKGQQIGWRVVFPTRMVPKAAMRNFYFSTFGSSSASLEAAVAYRDESLQAHLSILD